MTQCPSVEKAARECAQSLKVMKVNQFWWRAFIEAVRGCVSSGMVDKKEINRIATEEADAVVRDALAKRGEGHR